MTKKQAERLTGYEVRRIDRNDGNLWVGAFDGSQMMAAAKHRTESAAIRFLVQVVYGMHSRTVLKNHDWRCARCGSGGRLHVHHKQFRSHGGTHQVENLEPVCVDCHRAIHARELPEQRPEVES